MGGYRRRQPRVPLLYSDKKRVHLQYRDDTAPFLDTTTTTGFDYRDCLLTGLHDVNPTLGNIAVPGFDTWSAMYSRYRVVTAKLHVRFDNISASPIQVGMVATTPSQTTEISTLSRTEALVMPANKNAKTRWLSRDYGSNSSTVLTKTWRMSKLFTQSQEYFSDPSWTGTPTTNPSKAIRGYFWAMTQSGTAANATIPVTWWIDFWVDFFDPRKDFT